MAWWLVAAARLKVEGRVFKCVNTERARRGGFKQNGTDSPRNRAVEQFTYAADPIERLKVLQHVFVLHTGHNEAFTHAVPQFLISARLDA